jgi:SAM-dependent methyltransferase
VASIKTNIPYIDAKPILDTLREDLIPAELRAATPAGREAAWPDWVSHRDGEIRARVALGDEDSIVNLVLFGTTFTALPRATERQIDTLGGPASADAATLVRGRIEDLIAGLASPGTNSRLQFVRAIVERRGINPTPTEGQQQARQYVIDVMTRVGRESDAYDRAVQAAGRTGDPAGKLVELATLFRGRGLSSDTSIFPNLAIEEALEAIKTKGLLGARPVRRVAIVGPGLDFVDKAHGYDFYPEQTIQPFAVIDSLIRLGLAAPDALRVATFDVSPRVNEHLESARQRARGGRAYLLHLVRDRDEHWTPALEKYWERWGNGIGREVKAIAAPPAAGNVQVRALGVRPSVVMSITPQDLNVVLQRLEPVGPVGPVENDRFDLIVATNILVYYEVFEQSMALINVARMLRPGGLFLSNDTLLELPRTPLTAVGSTEVVYTDKLSGSRLSWYQRQ